MNIDEYLIFVAGRLKSAQENGQKDEVIRLLNLLRGTIEESIQKIENQK